ncbi:MAG TPA: hypothetical protein VFJ60_04230 [Gaiella sp.]|nr:hypothetical protein [Gaiella sp.]
MRSSATWTTRRRSATRDFAPELVLHELPDLSDDLAKIGDG